MLNCIGIDFGTTNTVLSTLRSKCEVEPVTYSFQGRDRSLFESVLCFSNPDDNNKETVSIGPWAIDDFRTFLDDCRFIQSFKTFAANESFQSTQIFKKRKTYADLMSDFLRPTLSKLPTLMSLKDSRVVIGRPVKFAGFSPSEELARERYMEAAELLELRNVSLVYEPVAAAYFFAQNLRRKTNVLVADFGGGTSDFSIMQFSRSQSGKIGFEAVGEAGIGIAGDKFDHRLVDNIVCPALGKGTQYNSFDKLLDIPMSYYSDFARWHKLSLMANRNTIQELRSLSNKSLEPEKIKIFIDFLESNLAFELFSSIGTLKKDLSVKNQASISFKIDDNEVNQIVHRNEFETWIEKDIDKLAKCLDELFVRSKLNYEEIGAVFLTGGTSFVPAVRKIFVERFGTKKIEAGNEFVSISRGLALIGADDDFESWTS